MTGLFYDWLPVAPDGCCYGRRHDGVWIVFDPRWPGHSSPSLLVSHIAKRLYLRGQQSGAEAA